VNAKSDRSSQPEKPSGTAIINTNAASQLTSRERPGDVTPGGFHPDRYVREKKIVKILLFVRIPPREGAAFRTPAQERIMSIVIGGSLDPRRLREILEGVKKTYARREPKRN